MKFKALLIIVLLIFIFSGCGTENSETETTEVAFDSNSNINYDAIDKFNNAIDNFFNSNSYTISANTAMNIAMEDQNKTGGLEMTADIKAKNDSNGNKMAEFKTVFNMGDQEEENSGYFKDGFFYNTQNKKVKVDYSEVLTEGNINIFKLTNNVVAIDPIVTKTDEGEKVEFDLNVAVLQKETPDFIPKLTAYLRVSEYDFIMNRCKISAVIDNNGILKSCDYIIKAKDTLYDGTSDENFRSFNVDCDIKINVDISNINNTDFYIPDDLEDYTDVTPDNKS